MADTKFSQIADGSAFVVATDKAITLRSGTTDLVTTLAAVAASGSATDLTTGTLPAARLPNPSSSTLGGIQSAAAVSHQFITSISTSGVPALAQPAASDVSGLAASATTDTTNAANISSGTIPSARLGVVGGTYLGDATTTAQTITIIEYAPYGFTINSLRNLGTVSGTATGTLNINGTPVTGCSSLSLTSTPQTGTATAANVVSAGNTVTFVTSSPSSLTGLLPFSLIATR